MSHRELFLRGLGVPTLVTFNVRAVHAEPWWWAALLVLVTGFLISFVWAGTVQGIAAAMKSRGAKVAYALGASVGSLLGMVVGRCIA